MVSGASTGNITATRCFVLVNPAAYGDLLAAGLALLALIALRRQMGIAIGAVWLFNLVGTIDLLNALRHVDVAQSFGSAWYIPTLLVPVLLITHFMIFVRLLEPVAESADAAVA